MSTDMDLGVARSKLDALRGELGDLRRSLEEDAVDPGRSFSDEASSNQHPADVGSDAFERTKDVSILSSIDRRLSDVHDALVRIERGRYGTCQACGEAIDPARLEARPDVRFCIRDQERAERDG